MARAMGCCRIVARTPTTQAALAAQRPQQTGHTRNVRGWRAAAAVPPGAGGSGGPPTGGGGQRDYKVALITGGNTGIGFETAKALLQQDYYCVLGCRDAQRGEAARARLRELVPSARGVELAVFDLADLESVRTWAARAQDFGLPLDLLVNNAGVMACPEQRTVQGHEYQLGVNHLGHFLLTSMLLPLLSDPGRSSRVVNVSSSAHYFGKINFEDIDSRQSYQPWVAYGQSKLANVMFTYELARRLDPGTRCTATTLHPGVVNTELARYLRPDVPAWWQTPLLKLGAAFTLTPEQGAQTSIYLASSPKVEGLSGKYFDKSKPVTSSAASYDEAAAARLWDLSSELVGL